MPANISKQRKEMERVCERGLLANSGTSPQQVTCVVPAITMSGVSVRQINANGRGVFDREVLRMLCQDGGVHTRSLPVRECLYCSSRNLNVRQVRETPDRGASPVWGGENSRFRLRWGGNRC